MAGGIDWFRWHHGSVTDPKFQLVARRSGASLPDVLAVWAYLLETASAAEPRGHIGSIDCEAWDCLFGFPSTETRTADILCALQDRHLIVDGIVTAWEKRQPKRERQDNEGNSSTARVRAFRGRQTTGSEGNAMDNHATPGSEVADQETPRNAMKRQKQPRGEERREEKKRQGGGSARAPDPAPSGAHPPPALAESPQALPSGAAQPEASAPDAMPPAWAAFIAEQRPDLVAAMVYASFCDHYPLRKRNDVTWRKWVRREFGGPLPGATATPHVHAITVPGRPGRDPAIARLEADAKRAVPPPPDVRSRIQQLVGKGKPAPAPEVAP